MIISTSSRNNNFLVEQGDDMEVNEADGCRNEDVDGVDGVVCREFDDALGSDL